MSSNISLASSPIGYEDTSTSQVVASLRVLRRIASFAIWSLPVFALTAPGRSSPLSFAVLDGLATLKLMLLVTVLCGAIPLIRVLAHESTARRTLVPLAPFVCYLGWAIVSVFWTPLRSVTLGQAGCLASLLLLTTFIALTCQDQVSIERVLKTLSQSLLLFSLFVLMVHFLAPSFSGLDRRMLVAGSDGVVHPTAASANASLGLLLVALCHFIGRYSWATRFAVLALLIHGTILYLASSRAALGMAVLTLPLIAFLYVSNRRRAFAMLALSGLAVGLMLFDPAFAPIRESGNTSVEYLARGQTTDQLKSVSGRGEMWSKIWAEYKKSKLIGHGYFVTSEAGAIRVWSMTANHTAHNILLQVLVSTGAIGLLLFLAAIIRLCTEFFALRGGQQQTMQTYHMLLFVFVWYVGWSLFCSSFMGPIRSESVVFFAFLGIGLGQAAQMRNRGAGEGTVE